MGNIAGCTDLLTPLDQSNQQALSSLPNTNYSSQDYSSMKTRLAQYLTEQYPDQFSDFVEGSLLIVLMELWAFLADLLSFKMDQIVNEIFIDTVTEIENAFRLCELVGYYPQPPIASRAFFSATMQQPLSVDLTLGNAIPVQLTTPSGTLTFELFPSDGSNNPILDGNIIITAGNLSNTNIIGLQGSTQIDNDVATGGANQSYTLQQSPVLYDSIRLSVDGVQWTEVDYFSSSNPLNEYRVEFDSNYVGYIIFGNGQAGNAPTQGSTIQITYRVGGGPQGNILAGTATTQQGFNIPGVNFPTPISFVNYTAGEYGYSGDTLAIIRNNLPAYVKTQNRAVTGEDYETLASQFVSPYNGQTALATAALRNYGCAGNVIDIYVLVQNGVNSVQEASDEFKVELSSYLDTVKMFTDQICIRDGVIILVDVTIDVIIDLFYQKYQSQILSSIQLQVNGFFLLSNWNFGQNLVDVNLIKSISSVSQVNSATVSFATSDPNNGGITVTALYYELIQLDQLTINLVFQ